MNIVYGEYTYWKYGDNSRVLPETQQYFKYISSKIAMQTDKINIDWFADPIITSNNDILVYGYNETYGQITLYQFDENLHLKSNLILASNLSNYNIKALLPIYHEYNNNKYYIYYLTKTKINDTNDIHGQLLVIRIENHEILYHGMNILWQFDHYVVDTTPDYKYTSWQNQIDQPLVYHNHIWFQHKNIQTNDYVNESVITRYLFSVDDGSVIWKKTDDKQKYETEFTPIIFDKYDQISVIYGYTDFGYNNLANGALYSFDFNTGELNWYRNYSDYLWSDYVFISLSGNSAIYHEYDLLIQGGRIEWVDYGFAVMSAFNLSNKGEMVKDASVWYDRAYPFVFNSRNGMNDLIVQFTEESSFEWLCNCDENYLDYNLHIQNMYIQVNDSEVQFKRTCEYSCAVYLNIESPIDSYSSIIASTMDGICVITKNGRGNIIRSQANYPLIPNHINHEDISEQLIYFMNHEKNRIVAHYNSKDSSKKLICFYNCVLILILCLLVIQI